MTTTEPHYEAPVVCMPWCSRGDGHPTEITTDDQLCDNRGNYLCLPLNDRFKLNEISYAQIGVGAERRVGFLPCVYVHLTLMEPHVDAAARLTAAEARWLAAELLKTAELIEDSGGQQGPHLKRDPSGTGSP
jgi:hypothetical protein